MRCAANKNRCIHGDCSEKDDLICLTREFRSNILRTKRVYIPQHSHACEYHFENGLWDDIISMIFTYSANQIEDMVDLLRDHRCDIVNRFSVSTDLKLKTGLKRDCFNDLVTMLPSLQSFFSGDLKKTTKAITMFLYRMRTASTYESMAISFELSVKTVMKYIDAARNSLQTDFVPRFLGFENHGRDFLLNCTTEMARQLYCGNDNQKIVIVADGTYIYCNKSKNFDFQRETYSDQKKRNFVKPMVFVTTDGTYDVLGPYAAGQNDASIMKTIFQTHEEIMTVMKESDILLLDRGFRDCIDFLREKGLDPRMPEFVHKADRSGQLTTKKANVSRLVTACRFVVESRNGDIKMIWPIFAQTWNSYDLKHMMTDYRIGAALINRFFQKIESNRYDAPELATAMLSKMGDKNEFSDITSSFRFQKEVRLFEEIDEKTYNFPLLTKDDLKKISLGSYQIDQIAPYCSEVIGQNGKFAVFVSPENILRSYFGGIIEHHNIIEPVVFLTVFASRFRKRVRYNVYILVDVAKAGHESICGYSCECRHGLRTVGCCSHIMGLIGYMGYFRNNERELKKVAAFLDRFFNAGEC